MSEAPRPIPRTALVTGAAKRIGRAIALELGAAGYAVAVHYNRSRKDAEDTVREIAAQGGKAAALDCELADEAAVEKLVPRAAEAIGPLGVLVNNASVFEVDDSLSTTRESWDLNMEVNLRAPFVLSQVFARELPREAEGAIINVSDQRVWNLTPYFTSYSVSKVGLWAATQIMAMALAPQIRVNAIGPGPVLPSPRQTWEQFERLCRAMPLGRGAAPEEIARAVRFILETPSMTGQMIALDGGQHLGWSHSTLGHLHEE